MTNDWDASGWNSLTSRGNLVALNSNVGLSAVYLGDSIYRAIPYSTKGSAEKHYAATQARQGTRYGLSTIENA